MNTIENILDYLRYGIMRNSFEAKRHLSIYRKIAKQIDLLHTFDKEQQQLFGYIQSSAADSVVLKTSHIFDPHHRSFPIRSLPGLLNYIQKANFEFGDEDFPRLFIKDKLNLFPGGASLAASIESFTKNEFLEAFISFCQKSIKDHPISGFYAEIKHIRDKYIAHNESVVDDIYTDFTCVDHLTDFVIQMGSILETFLGIPTDYNIADDAIRETYFIDAVIEDLKEVQ